MGFRFRKSINLGGGFKVNLSKSGVGYSWGTKGVRYTKTASGKKRTTLSIPGTGISYVTESGNKKKVQKKKVSQSTNNFTAPSPQNTNNGGNNMAWFKFVICFLFGYFGVHKFIEKKIGMGILYLFTMGLFGFGWIYDCIKYLIIAIKSTNTNTEEPIYQWESASTEWSADNNSPVEIPTKRSPSIKKILLWVLTVFLALIALAYFPHISGIIALTAAAIVLPVEKWQAQISRFINGKKKTIIVSIMTVLAFFGTPTSEAAKVDAPEPTVAAMEFSMATEAATEQTEAPIVEVESISFDDASYSIGVGRSVDIPFTVYPENATNVTLECAVNNKELAEISLGDEEDRIIHVTGIVPGDIVITVKASQDIVAKKDVHIFEVIPEEITIVPDEEKPVIGSTGAFTIAYNPEDVTNQNVTWESSDPSIISVNPDGTYDAVAIGNATITATYSTDLTSTLEIEVTPIVVKSIALTSNWDTETPFYKRNSMNLAAEILPVDAVDKSIVWESSDESVATVSKKGVVTAVYAGTATITATSANGVQGHFEIVVEPSPQQFRMTASISMRSNDHVGNRWSTGFEFNGEAIRSGSTVSIMPGDSFSVYGWAEDGDSNPDYGDYGEKLTLTDEMCKAGFTIEGEADVYENGGRYSGNCATWYVKMTFTPIN
ncbi:MAG: DUF4236 domain-containing protein [Oscillospiraceae bacterium]